MLTTCTELSRRRLEKALKDANGHKEMILQVVICELDTLFFTKIFSIKSQMKYACLIILIFVRLIIKPLLPPQEDRIFKMKSDLELIFRKIRYFKSTLATKYPQIYQQGILNLVFFEVLVDVEVFSVSIEFAERRKANGEEDEEEWRSDWQIN